MKGHTLPALLLMPGKRPSAPVPGVLWLHGGGYMTGMAEMAHFTRARDLAGRCGAVMSPLYPAHISTSANCPKPAVNSRMLNARHKPAKGPLYRRGRIVSQPEVQSGHTSPHRGVGCAGDRCDGCDSKSDTGSVPFFPSLPSLLSQRR